ncbi:MAG: nucleotidyl transferase AbiEii/AbiGii toxin family protein [Coriobacteriales bacterium]|nr:nucleotidyl transferase AbiEii/AbiGii toxin family protein [Coriobacteriales bacterium]
MSSNAMSLKARIRNLAKEKNVTAQVLLQNYMFESFLYRLSQSEYKDKFVLKGGLLIAAIVGLDNRSTMDLDTTLRQLALTEENIRSAVESICAMPADDDVEFHIGVIQPIRADDIYGGYRVALTALFDTIETPLSIDVSTGDVITPEAVRFFLTGMFDDEKRIELWAYNIETVIAEKLETILRRNVLNTRPRDFYDIYILAATLTFDTKLLAEAMAATAAHRGTTEQISDIPGLLHAIFENKDLQAMWQKYQRQFSYASDIDWEKIMQSVVSLCEKLK